MYLHCVLTPKQVDHTLERSVCETARFIPPERLKLLALLS